LIQAKSEWRECDWIPSRFGGKAVIEEGDVEIECTLVRKTDDALLVKDASLRDPGREIWIPRSQVHLFQESFVGDEITIHIPEWLAIKEDLV
jgi:hypothetical protein